MFRRANTRNDFHQLKETRTLKTSHRGSSGNVEIDTLISVFILIFRLRPREEVAVPLVLP